jgi:XXXCH domain-containing protein
MGKKTVTVYGRNELADYLEDVAAQLRKGNLPFGSESLEVPDDFEARLSLKEKKHALSCKLEWRWAVPEGRALPGFHAEPGPVPSSFRQVKKDLARAFRAVKLAVNQGDTPDERLLAEFERLSRSFADRAEPEWERAAQEYLGHMENLFRSVRDGRKEAAIHEIQDLQGRMVSCHRDYK